MSDERRTATVVVAAGLLLTALSWHAAQAETLPLVGLIDTDQGTVEMWLRFDFDPLGQHEKSYHSYGVPLRLDWADPAYPEDALSVGLFSRHVAHRSRSGMAFNLVTQLAVGGQRMVRNLYIRFSQDVQRGQWHHYALTWSRRHRRVRQYHNGRLVSEWQGFMAHHFHPERFDQWCLFDAATFRLHYGRVVIDDIRLSFVERSPDQLGAHGALKPDQRTGLLLNFEQPENASDTPTIWPSYAATHAARQPIPVANDHRLTRGRFGFGLALYEIDPKDHHEE